MTTQKTSNNQGNLSLLTKKGYSLRTAAPLLGVHFGHLHKVLQGERESRRLLLAVESLPARKSKHRTKKVSEA